MVYYIIFSDVTNIYIKCYFIILVILACNCCFNSIYTLAEKKLYKNPEN